jgi:hypothetical protein
MAVMVGFTKHYRAADGGQAVTVTRGEKMFRILFIVCSSFVGGRPTVLQPDNHF